MSQIRTLNRHFTVTNEKYQLEETIVIYYHKISLHVSGIYMPIFRSTGCMLLHMVFSTVNESSVLVDHGLCCLVCYIVINQGCVAGCVGFRCHVMCVLLGVGAIMG